MFIGVRTLEQSLARGKLLRKALVVQHGIFTLNCAHSAWVHAGKTTREPKALILTYSNS